MDILKTVLSALASLLVMFVLTRLLGKRQVSQLNFFDYINGITIGSIAAEMALAEPGGLLRPAVAMAVYAAVCLLIALLANKSIAARRFFVGKPTVLYENGRLYEKNLAAAHLDVNEFLTHLRTQGYFDLSEVQSAVLEINGSVSVLPCSGSRPATPDDLKLIVEPAGLCANVVIDGRIMAENLRHTGNNETLLQNELAKQGAQLKEVILATVNAQNELSVYTKTGEQNKRDLFI